MKLLKFVLIALLGLMLLVSCEDSKNDDNNAEADAWIGTWLSAGTDVAPLLVALFAYDSIRVVLNDDNTLTLDSHVANGAWTSLPGTYVVTESEEGDIHGFAANYTAFEQDGIIEIIGDNMRLEAVQTVPDIGALVPTVAAGFGANPALGTFNIQTYKRVN